MKQTIGANLRILRKSHSLTQTQMSQMTGIGNSSISQWERQIYKPNAKTIAQLATFFKVNPSDITGDYSVITNTTIGNTIKQFRKAKSLTQEKLGSMFGVSQITISQWETGKTEPTPEQLIVISKALGSYTSKQPVSKQPVQQQLWDDNSTQAQAVSVPSTPKVKQADYKTKASKYVTQVLKNLSNVEQLATVHKFSDDDAKRIDDAISNKLKEVRNIFNATKAPEKFTL